MIQLTEQEFASICVLAHNNSLQEGEDVIGVLMKNGAFWILREDPHKDDSGLVDLAKKIEEGNKLFQKLRQEKLDDAKQYYRRGGLRST